MRRWFFYSLLDPDDLFLSLPHDPAEISLTREHDARRRLRLDEELIAFDPEVAPLSGTIPGFVPRNIDQGDEVITIDPVFATIRKH
jgi:hypothetical protein